VLGQFRNPADYGAALDRLAGSYDYLAGWVAKGPTSRPR
jgi:hypothetical protein